MYSQFSDLSLSNILLEYIFKLTMKSFKTLKIQKKFQQITVRCTNGSLE